MIRIAGKLRRASALAPLALAAAACTEQRAPEDATAEWSGNPVLVIGVDGATWDVMKPMLERGELPSFRALMERGVHGPLFSIPPVLSPCVWTSMATGHLPRHHGLLDHTYPYVDGPKSPVDTRMRKDPALWNIASHYGRSVGTVSYYITHPVEEVEGFMVSDRAWLGLPGGVYPEGLLDPIRTKLDAIQREVSMRRLLKRFVTWDYDAHADAKPGDPYYTANSLVRGLLDRQVARDEYTRRSARRLVRNGVDLFLVNFYLTDFVCHTTWSFYDPTDFAEKPDPFDVELLGHIIPETYRLMDEYVGELVEAAPENANVIVFSDHGFGSATGIWVDEREDVSGNHRHDGILVAAGPDIGSGSVEGVTTMGMAPLILTLLGLPISDELTGRLEQGVLRDGHPVRRVPAYSEVPRGVLTDAQWFDAESDVETMHSLKALGYVGESTPVAEERAGIDFDFWSIDPSIRGYVLTGELVFHLLHDDLDAAEEVWQSILEQVPEEAEGLAEALGKLLDSTEEDLARTLYTREVRQLVGRWKSGA